MSRNKRQNKEIIISADKNLHYEFIFTAGNPQLENLKIFDESLKRLKKEYSSQCSFIIVDSPENHALKIIEKNSDALALITSPLVQIINNPGEKSTTTDSEPETRVSIWLNLSKLVRYVTFNEFFRTEIPVPSEDEYYQINWEEEKSSHVSGLVLNPETSDILLTQNSVSGDSGICKTQKNIRQAGLFRKFLTLKHPCPFETKFNFSKINFNPAPALRSFANQNITGTFRKFPLLDSKIPGNIPLNRLIFFITALLILVILPVISYKAGISGDEEKHYAQAAKVYNYFATDGKDTASLSDEKYKLNYYGQSFDLFTYAFIKKFHIQKIYETRHVMNGIFGASAILCSGILARILFGNIAGIFTMVLLFFSPGYLGHSMNNPLDIPFAFGYIFTLLQLVRFLKRLPVINYWIALLIAAGIAFTISIRIGGLLLIPYIFMFSGLYLYFTPMPWEKFSPHWIKLAGRGILILTGISILAFFVSILPWPYARQNPLKNPFEAMKMMENISVALRVLFEGKIFWSDNLPATYIPKNILLSVPLIVLAGFVSSIFFIRKNQNAFWLFFLFFVVVFPVAYIIYKESNVYGAWRHLLFIYPPMVILAGMGLQSLMDNWENKYIKYSMALVFAGAMVSPVTHIFRNYPNQYIYFNEIAGGVKKAYKKYETDYYMVSLKPGTDWIKDNILKNTTADSAHPVRIVSNAPADIMNYYFREYKNKVKLPYTRYYDRGIYDWDYAIFFCNYIDPYQINHNIWPPKNTIYTVNLDGVKICAIVKRDNKDDYKGYELMNRAIRSRNKAELDESIILMENALRLDPHNEISYLNVAQAYIMKEQFEMARRKLNDLLAFYPNYEKALNLIGYSYLNEGEIHQDNVKIDRAISIFNEVIKINYKFAGAYHNLGLANLILGDDTKAFEYFQKSIDNNPAAKDSYFMMAAILEKRGDINQARQIRDYASRL
jgi:tetratricopeptide (TPR) repeat protein